jgi:hypothetical protein
MTLFADNRNKRCLVACPQYKIDSGQCSCYNRIEDARIAERKKIEEEIEDDFGQSFVFRGVRYVVGEKVKVSGHYAGYKAQYNFMVGILFLDNEKPMVKIEINPNDIEQTEETSLEVWNVIEKI